jgi:hypothetical protein
MFFSSWLRKSKSRPRTSRRAGSTVRLRLEALEDRCVPSTLTVTTYADSGPGSLRDDIAAARSKDTIVFAPSLDGQTITLTSGYLLVNKDLTIAGPGASQLTVSGGGKSEVFHVSGYDSATGKSSRINFSLSELTISNGDASTGGGIYVDYLASLTLSGCTLSGNSASWGGAIYNWHGTVTITGCTLSGNTVNEDGGAIFNNGTMTISNSTLSGNSAVGPDFGIGDGGAIYNQKGASLTVSGCALSNNIAGGAGGAIYNTGLASTLTVLDSTFSGNKPNNIFGLYTDAGGNIFA